MRWEKIDVVVALRETGMTGRVDSPSYWLSGVTFEDFPVPADLPAKAEVVIVGGGLMGVSIAYWLSRLGVDVLLTESRWLSWGATGRNAGLMLAGASPLEAPELLESVLSQEDIKAEYAETGHLALASSEKVWDKIRAEVLARKSSAKALYALEPDACEDLLKMRIARSFHGGRWFPQGGMIHSTRFVYGLARAAMRYGASIVAQTCVSKVESAPLSEQLVVRTSRGSVKARHVVYACNARVGELLPEMDKLITPVVGQVLSTEPLPAMFRIGLAVDWGTVYWRQTPDGSIVLGGNPAQEPVDKGCVEKLNLRIQESLAQFLPRAFPGFPDFRISKQWAGIMDCTEDNRPIVGPLPGRQNQWVAVGFNGHGMPLGLGIGKAVAEAISTGIVPAALLPFRPARFAELLTSDS